MCSLIECLGGGWWQVRDVSKVFQTRSGTNVAVDGVSLQLEPHSFTAFLGPSGSGIACHLWTSLRCVQADHIGAFPTVSV